MPERSVGLMHRAGPVLSVAGLVVGLTFADAQGAASGGALLDAAGVRGGLCPLRDPLGPFTLPDAEGPVQWHPTERLAWGRSEAQRQARERKRPGASAPGRLRCRLAPEVIHDPRRVPASAVRGGTRRPEPSYFCSSFAASTAA